MLSDTVQQQVQKELRQGKTMACSFCRAELAISMLHLKNDDINIFHIQGHSQFWFSMLLPAEVSGR